MKRPNKWTHAAAAAGLAMMLAGCATSGGSQQQTLAVSSNAEVSCQTSKQLPPTLLGTARSGTGQQPVLVVGCQRHQESHP